jgi:isochorismate pyruvate lyase
MSKLPNECTTIEEVRHEIDLIDQQIINLIAQRKKYVFEVVKYKKTEDDVFAKERYNNVFVARRRWAEESGLNPDTIESVYKTLVHYFIDEQLKVVAKRD